MHLMTGVITLGISKSYLIEKAKKENQMRLLLANLTH
jgi:hypothetical protein